MMKDSQILSVFNGRPIEPGSGAIAAPAALVFDTCQVGIVARAVLFVQTVMAVAAMFGSGTLLDWLSRLALMTGAALPATLLWLLVVCSLRRHLAALPAGWPQVGAVILGALAGLYGCAMLALLSLLPAPPWLGSAAAGALLSAVLVATLVLRAKAKAPAAAAARLAELQARIRPHFLFNTLNSAIALVHDEPRKAERLLEDLSELFRHAMKDAGESVTLAEEIALARAYLAIEQVRFGERIRVEWALDELANPAKLPPLALQPLVENAVRHGVEPSASGADIKISTQRRGSRVVVKICNTTPTASTVPGSGLGLNNVRERLGLLHDVQAQFYSGWRDGGFQVRIELPA